jgi:hypothetical protein
VGLNQASLNRSVQPKYCPLTYRRAVRGDIWNEKKAFNTFPGKVEVDPWSSFENLMSCLFMENYVMLLIYLVKMCLKCLHTWVGCELHFLQSFSSYYQHISYHTWCIDSYIGIFGHMITHLYRQSWYYQSFINSPTDELVSCFKRKILKYTLKFTLKQLLHASVQLHHHLLRNSATYTNKDLIYTATPPPF